MLAHFVLAYVALFVGLGGIALSAIFVKLANVPGAPSGFYRMAIAAAVMAVPFGLHLRQRLPLSKRHVGFAILAGLFFAGDLATWNTAILIGSAANATLFGNTSPLWVGLGAMLLFKQRLGRPFWIGMLVALVGVIVILGHDLTRHPTISRGDMLGLIAGFCYGLFFLATERARTGLGSLGVWWISAVTSAVVLLVVGLLLGQPFSGYSTTSWVNLLTLALVVQVLGWMSISYALGHLPASIVSTTLLAQPVLTAIAAVPLLGETITTEQLAGGVLVLAGIYLVHRGKVPVSDRRGRENPQTPPAPT
jgi:drug/metabolite transporter (DMT)-like permease